MPDRIHHKVNRRSERALRSGILLRHGLFPQGEQFLKLRRGKLGQPATILQRGHALRPASARQVESAATQADPTGA